MYKTSELSEISHEVAGQPLYLTSATHGVIVYTKDDNRHMVNEWSVAYKVFIVSNYYRAMPVLSMFGDDDLYLPFSTIKSIEIYSIIYL